jgi:hypothetical protein
MIRSQETKEKRSKKSKKYRRGWGDKYNQHSKSRIDRKLSGNSGTSNSDILPTIPTLSHPIIQNPDDSTQNKLQSDYLMQTIGSFIFKKDPTRIKEYNAILIINDQLFIKFRFRNDQLSTSIFKDISLRCNWNIKFIKVFCNKNQEVEKQVPIIFTQKEECHLNLTCNYYMKLPTILQMKKSKMTLE